MAIPYQWPDALPSSLHYHIMNRVGNEVVTQQPLRYASTFKIPPSMLDADRSIASGRCGLGWSFSLSRVTTSVTVDSHAPSLGRSVVRKVQTRDVVRVTVRLNVETWMTSLGASLRVDSVFCELDIPGFRKHNFRKTCNGMGTSIDLGTMDYSPNARLPSAAIGQGVEPEEPKLIILSVSVLVDQSLRPQPEAFHSRVVPALAQSITTGQLADTKVYLYSRHSGKKSARMPLPSYLNSAIVFEFGCGDLNDLLTAEGFKDTAMVAIDAYALKQEDQCVDNYDYDSDSDLEEEDEQGLSAYHPVDGEIETQEVPGESKVTDENQDEPPQQLDDLLEKVQATTRTRFLRIGRVLVIRNTAFRTWNALIRYIYFNSITFSKLKSSFPNATEARKRFEDKESCSPKSMYRLADRLGINDLKRLALVNIDSQMNTQNITRETFSHFSSWYPEILDAQTQTFLKVCSIKKSVRDEVIANMEKALPVGQQFLTHAVRKLLEKAEI